VNRFARLALASACLACSAPSWVLAQIADSPDGSVAGIPVNYTESKVGVYTLPDPLTLASGERVADAATWTNRRRPELVKLFEENQFGRAPGRPAAMHFDVFDAGTPAFDGKAIRRQVTIYLAGDDDGPKIDLLVYLPAKADGPVPVLLNLSFAANSLTVDDPGVKEGTIWNREGKRVPASQGRSFGHANVLSFLDRGIGYASFYYGDVEPDFPAGLPLGIRGRYLPPGQIERGPADWGAIAAWAWGISRAIDYFETDDGVDAQRVAILGISRLGKTVLWAGARDERVALVVAICSGEGGAALSRRNYGETIAHLTAPTRYPYQFAANYAKWGDRVSEFPVDAHLLLALLAPRPVLLVTGNTDKWSDPYGEFLAGKAAAPVYALFGKQGLDVDKLPAPGEPVIHDVGFFMHDSGHGTVPSDWDVIRDFLAKHLNP